MHVRWGRLLGALAVTVGLLAGLLWGLSGLARPAEGSAVAPLARPYDPVVVTGSVFSAFQSIPVDELALYRFRAGVWEPVLFQVDEVDASGTYTTSDGTLDANDELVAMASDAGEFAAPAQWPADPASQSRPRYAIQVRDPLDPAANGWLYLFYSPTLPPAGGTYVTWQEEAQQVVALSYTAAFTEAFIGLADLRLNGFPQDILDRQKLRVDATFTPAFPPFPIPVSFNEETILDLLPAPPTVTLPITGPVRAIGGTSEQRSAFYAARYEAVVALPLTDTTVTTPTNGTIHFETLRTSLDLNPPATSGMAPTTYFDPNVPAGVPVDGTPDAVPALPPVGWYEETGALGGLVVVESVDPASGTRRNYYKDDATVDENDTGDGRSYGDSGVRVDDPNGTVRAATTLFVLEPGTGNVGAALQAQANAPLFTLVTAETFPGSTPTATTTGTATRTATGVPSSATATRTPTATTTGVPPSASATRTATATSIPPSASATATATTVLATATRTATATPTQQSGTRLYLPIVLR